MGIWKSLIKRTDKCLERSSTIGDKPRPSLQTNSVTVLPHVQVRSGVLRKSLHPTGEEVEESTEGI